MIGAQLTGIFPRSRELVEATRSYDKGLMDMESLMEFVKKDAIEAIRLQQDYGLNCLMQQ